jgi:hypothetical protein
MYSNSQVRVFRDRFQLPSRFLERVITIFKLRVLARDGAIPGCGGLVLHAASGSYVAISINKL